MLSNQLPRKDTLRELILVHVRTSVRNKEKAEGLAANICDSVLAFQAGYKPDEKELEHVRKFTEGLLDIGDFFGREKSEDYSSARYLYANYLFKSGVSMSQIGRIMGNRTEPSIRYLLTHYDARVRSCPRFRHLHNQFTEFTSTYRK